MAKKTDNTFDPLMRIIVLHGSERFLIEEQTRRILEVLDARFGGVEQFGFDGETVQPATVLDELRSYGLMMRHKLVIVDNADLFLSGGKNEDEDSDQKKAPNFVRPMMEKYAANPVPEATLLLRAQTWRKGNLDKLIAKVGAIHECDTLSDAAAANWCVKNAPERHGTKIDPDAAQLLVTRLGPELQHLDTEMMKLAVLAQASGLGSITRELVGQNIGMSREEKAWEIQNAIVAGDAAIMIQKLHELIDVSRQDVVPLNWSVCDLVRKIHAASQLLRRGVPERGVMSQLRLWGSTVEPMLALARSLEPSALAQLLQAAIDTDRAAKSGLGEPVRSLEALLVRIADNFERALQRH